MNQHPSSSGPGPGFRRGPRIADQMTRDYEKFLDSAVAAERAGDAEAALAYHRGIPMFSRSAHSVVLRQLVGLAEEMTPWLWARWAAYQCTRAEEQPESREIVQESLKLTMEVFHPDVLAEAYLAGDDPMPQVARTMGQDWVFHQVCTFEMGGLVELLESLATGRLAREAGLARQWVGARMGGYRLEPSEPGRLVVHDLARDRPVELLDLGAGVHAEPGDFLIGRLVPSGVEPGWMFDTRPVPVDRQLATECAESREFGGWIAALARAVAEERIDRAVLRSEDRELVTDVPSLALLTRATRPGAMAVTMEQLYRGRDEVGRAAYRLLRDAVAGSVPDSDAAYVAAAVVHPHGYDEVQRLREGAGHPDDWARWVDLVPDPARGRLARLAELSRASAA